MSEETSQPEQFQAAVRELAGEREHLRELTDRLDVMLGRWTRLEEHHARALADLQHSAGRVQQLERRLQQYMEKAPSDGFIRPPGDTGPLPGTVKTLMDAFERIEVRLAAREAEVGRWMLEARSDLQSATMLLKGTPKPDVAAVAEAEHPPAPAGPPTTGPPAEPRSRPPAEPQPESHSPGPMFVPDPSGAADRSRYSIGLRDTGIAGGADPLEEVAEPAGTRSRRVAVWIVLPAALIAGAIAIGYSLQLRGRVLEADARARSAERYVLSAQEQAMRQLEAVRAASEREVVNARESAAKANAIADVLASPDLIRFDLAGTPLAPRARGQGLWSRSRGLVFTATRLPPLPEGSVYQLWLVTSAAPVNAGSVTPDSMGRVTFLAEGLPSITVRVVGLLLTSETQGEHQAPEGAAYLARVVIETS